MIVRKLRLQRGWSQDQLAELADVSVRTIQRVERGQKPSLETSKALAAVFEVDLSTFISEDELVNDHYEAQEKIELRSDEAEAINYAKGIKEFFGGLLTYVVLAVVFFAVAGFDEPVLYWIFLGVGIGLIVQGLMAFEVIRLPWHNWEKRMIEKRLGRKL